MTMLHFKIKLNNEHPNVQLKSKEEIEVQYGFRKIIVSPLYSRFFQNNNKTKYDKKMYPNIMYLASFYQQTIYAPQNIIFYKTIDYNQKVIVASGELFKVDPLHVILKRKILTGYPFRVHKKKAVIKLMFFNQKDVNYFKPIELSSKFGLRGHIMESLGTHGLMKCLFNKDLRQNDTICLNLYRRVFPPFKFQFLQN